MKKVPIWHLPIKMKVPNRHFCVDKMSDKVIFRSQDIILIAFSDEPERVPAAA